MKVVLIIFNALTLLSVAILHLYWVLGGKWAIDAALPTNPTGKKVFLPGKLATASVAMVLMLFAVVMILNFGMFYMVISQQFTQLTTQVIGAIFILRGMGDVKYLGVTKRIKNTKFAVNDTRIYTPLCLLIGIVSFLIVWL